MTTANESKLGGARGGHRGPIVLRFAGPRACGRGETEHSKPNAPMAASHRYNNLLKSMGATTSKDPKPGGSESRGGVTLVNTNNTAAESEADKYNSTSTYALSRRRATELFFLGAVMQFLVFSEVLEMSSEVVGPGPTHGRSNLSGLTWDLLLVPSRPMPDACYPLVCLLCCVWGVSSRGAVLAVPSVVPVLVLQDSTSYRLQVV